jgi:hypothetical protein
MSERLHPAYLAGIIDGEGSIFPRYHRNPHITVSNTSAALIEQLMRFGGHVQDRKGRGLGTKPAQDWVISGERAAIILRACLPYLIVKREKAEAALAAWDEGASPNHQHFVRLAREALAGWPA